MRGEQWRTVTRTVTQRVYPAAIVILAIGASLPVAVFIWQRGQIRPPDTAIEATLVPDTPSTSQSYGVPPRPFILPSPASPATGELVPAPLSTASRTVPAPPQVASDPSRVPPTDLLGSLRVSNRTTHPIRVALLAQHSQTDPAPADPSASPYDEPIHWDFAPQEGSTSGLILSLPEQTLRLQPGDILVAFAQDGSRRYWGPYVVGETPAPLWQASEAEWQLILTP